MLCDVFLRGWLIGFFGVFVVGLWYWGYGVEFLVRKKGGDDGEVLWV